MNTFSLVVTLLTSCVLLWSSSTQANRIIGTSQHERHAELYKDTDPIVQMVTIDDFKSKVVGTSHAWLIEFYSSWCGHCIKFAPDFIRLAHDVKGWNKVIQIGAVDCAKQENIPLCRDYEITGYPTLKFFPAFAEPSYIGMTRRGSKRIDVIRRNMIDFVEIQLAENKASPQWPLLSLLNGTLDEMWIYYNKNDEIILLFEAADDGQYWSREVILDAPVFKPIRRVNSDRWDVLDIFNITQIPSLVFLKRSGSYKVFPVDPDREIAGKVLQEVINGVEALRQPNSSADEGKVPDEFISNKRNTTTDHVYMADLEGALLYAFGHEVSVRKVIEDEQITALKLLVDVLNDYFPGNEEMMHTIETVKTKLQRYDVIGGDEFAQLWSDALAGRRSAPEWMGCRGSQPHLRGYPCSLWTTFHTLTVNYALKTFGEDHSADPALILKTMKGFVKHFFGCSHCSSHFVSMADDETDPIEAVESPRQAVLWLWAAHNKVNRRLSGDATEDPEAPKIQFPSVTNCPECHLGGVESEQGIYEYLVKVYRSEHIVGHNRSENKQSADSDGNRWNEIKDSDTAVFPLIGAIILLIFGPFFLIL